jgi:transcription antitermination factor NusG
MAARSGLKVGDRVSASKRVNFDGAPGVWRAIQTKPSCEMRVVEALKLYKLDAYTPEETIARVHHGRTTPRNRPLIRGYVFACLPIEAEYLVHEVDGAVQLVRHVGVTAVVDPAFVARMRRYQDEGRFDHTPAGLERDRREAALRRRQARRGRPVRPAQPRREVGDEVSVAEGPFAGLVGKIARISAGRRAEVVLRMLQANCRITFDLAALEVVAAPQPLVTLDDSRELAPHPANAA